MSFVVSEPSATHPTKSVEIHCNHKFPSFSPRIPQTAPSTRYLERDPMRSGRIRPCSESNSPLSFSRAVLSSLASSCLKSQQFSWYPMRKAMAMTATLGIGSWSDVCGETSLREPTKLGLSSKERARRYLKMYDIPRWRSAL